MDNNSKIFELEHRITTDLNDLEKCIPSIRRSNIQLPIGIVKKVRDLLPEYQFIQNKTIQRNICYAIESLQFYEWILKRFASYGPIKSYLVKISIILADMVVEAMTREFIHQKNVRPHRKHSKNISKLKGLGISDKLISSIEALHSRRSNIHLHLVTDLENEKYTATDWYKSLKCLYDSKSEYTRLL
jgi:hypothetical protein